MLYGFGVATGPAGDDEIAQFDRARFVAVVADEPHFELLIRRGCLLVGGNRHGAL